MSIARFSVKGRFDGADEATIAIDRHTGIVSVRPKRRRDVATVTLAWIAEVALWKRAQTVAAARRGRARRG